MKNISVQELKEKITKGDHINLEEGDEEFKRGDFFHDSYDIPKLKVCKQQKMLNNH